MMPTPPTTSEISATIKSRPPIIEDMDRQCLDDFAHVAKVEVVVVFGVQVMAFAQQ